MNKYILPLCTAVVLAACVALAGFLGSVKLGFVNSREIIAQSDAGKAAAAELDTFLKEKNAAVQNKRDELVRQATEFEQLRKTMKPEEAKDKEQTLERRKLELQLAAQQAQRDIQVKDQELTQKFLPEAVKVIRDMGAKEGYTAIFDLSSGQIVYSDTNSDITKQVLGQLNQRFNADKAKGEAK